MNIIETINPISMLAPNMQQITIITRVLLDPLMVIIPEWIRIVDMVPTINIETVCIRNTINDDINTNFFFIYAFIPS